MAPRSSYGPLYVSGFRQAQVQASSIIEKAEEEIADLKTQKKSQARKMGALNNKIKKLEAELEGASKS